jgi:hypothetical protein
LDSLFRTVNLGADPVAKLLVAFHSEVASAERLDVFQCSTPFGVYDSDEKLSSAVATIVPIVLRRSLSDTAAISLDNAVAEGIGF